MRTTIELPDALLKEAKVRAVEKGVSLKELVQTALERELGLQGSSEEGRSFPILKSKAPGALTLTNREIDDLLADEDAGTKKEPV